MVLVAKLAIDPVIQTETRKFAARQRGSVLGYLDVKDALERRDHLDLLRAVPWITAASQPAENAR